MEGPVVAFRLLQILALYIDRCKHDVLDNCLIIVQIEMLEHHSHTAAVDIDINLWVCDIDTIEDNLSACWIFHTVQAAQKCTLPGAGRTDDNHNVALVHSDVDAFQDFIVTKMFFKINDFYHSFSGSFPSF